MVTKQKWQIGNDNLVTKQQWQIGNDNLVTKQKWAVSAGPDIFIWVVQGRYCPSPSYQIVTLYSYQIVVTKLSVTKLSVTKLSVTKLALPKIRPSCTLYIFTALDKQILKSIRHFENNLPANSTCYWVSQKKAHIFLTALG